MAPQPPDFDRLQRLAVIVGAVGLGVCLVGGLFSPAQFFRSYLLAYVFWVGIALGCLAIVMIQHLSGGAWGLVLRRLLESGARTLPWMAALFLPLAFGLPALYGWARPDQVAADEILRHKQPYLNVPFFLARAAVYFLAWIAFAHVLSKWSLEQDRQPGPVTHAEVRRFQLVSGPGLMVYGLTVTFASVDWVMSLDPHWFSTIFGILFMGGQVLSAFSFMIAVLFLLSETAPFKGVLRPSHFHDLGKLLLAFVMLWAYFSFSQYLITWSGNLPEEIPWYLERLGGGWQWVALALVVGHFALPFLLLLSRNVKRRAARLAQVAAIVVLMRFVDLYWLIAPEFHGPAFGIHLLDVAAPLGLGGLWVALFVRQLKSGSLLPFNDPYLVEAMADGHH